MTTKQVILHYIAPLILCIAASWTTYKVRDFYNQTYNDHLLLEQVVRALSSSQRGK